MIGNPSQTQLSVSAIAIELESAKSESHREYQSNQTLYETGRFGLREYPAESGQQRNHDDANETQLLL